MQQDVSSDRKQIVCVFLRSACVYNLQSLACFQIYFYLVIFTNLIVNELRRLTVLYTVDIAVKNTMKKYPSEQNIKEKIFFSLSFQQEILFLCGEVYSITKTTNITNI